MHKKNKFKILCYISLWLFLIFYNFALITANNTNFEISWIWNDSWIWISDNLSFSWTNILFYDQLSSDYINNNKRIKILNSWAKMESKLYWTFTIQWNWIDLKKDSIKNISCNWTISYSFDWIIISDNDLWWKLKTIHTNNYYCPVTWKFNLPLTDFDDSWRIWTLNFSSSENIKTIAVINSYWKEIQVNVKNLFDSKKIYLNGSYLASSNIDNSSFEWELTKDLAQIKSQINIEWKITNLDSIIKKNVSILTKNRNPDWIWEVSDLSLSSINFNSIIKDFYYYNYKWKKEIWASHLNNFWKILQLWNWGSPNNFSKIQINWKNTLVVDGWNLYINADIYNKDKNSILVIVVKRDKTHKKNWWNIYINPNVTNIDAVLIADWSIFNYNWSQTNLQNNDLRRQLLIYWAVSTKNTIWWWNKAPYWSDDYIEKNMTSTIDWEYDFKNLRNFQAISSNQLNSIIPNNCFDANGKITALWNSSNIALKYAFAWKKECYLDETTKSWLRGTDKLSPLVIIYNPLIQINPPSILKIK
jgi:hypothetical protein